MNYNNGKAENIKIAYIGGGSRGWAWGLMSDLASCDDISGDVYLYDIDFEAAQHNEIIGNMYKDCENAKSVWNYKAVETAKDALTGADFVIISILPGTFDEMESDVHAPEKYGIYQSVGIKTALVKNIGAGDVVHCAFWIVHTRKINTHLARCKRIKLSLFTFVCIKQVD